MNFNPNTIKIERNLRFTENIEKQERFLKKIEKNKELYAPKEKDFTDVYPEEEVEKDINLVSKIKKGFSIKNENEFLGNPEMIEKKKRVSDIYEGVIVEQAEQNAWFGENVNFYSTSEYDDLINGVDGVAEFFSEDGESKDYTAMSFDVVFSGENEKGLDSVNYSDYVEGKLNKTKKSIDNGELIEVKYFEDNEGNKKTLQAPRIILGSRLVSAENLINLWGSKHPDRNKKLAEHPIQIKLLLETYLQAYHFYNYAKEVEQDEIANSYGTIANKIAEIINSEKKELFEKHYDEISDDIVFNTVKNYCDSVEI